MLTARSYGRVVLFLQACRYPTERMKTRMSPCACVEYPGRLVKPRGYTSTDSTSWLRRDSKMQVSEERVPSTYTWGWILRWKAF